MTYIRSQSRTGYDRRYEDKVFAPGTRCVEMVDYVGTGDKPFGEDEGPAKTPEEAFVKRLRKSGLFDEDKSFTRLLSYVAADSVRNFGTFRIRAKFTEPIEFFQVQGNR